MNNLKASILGYVSSVGSFIALGWGDAFKAFVVGFAGAAGGVIANLLWKTIKKIYEKRGF